MSEDNECFVSVGSSNVGSRIRQKSQSKRHVQKREKYSKPPGYSDFSSPCSHNSKRFQCSKFSPCDCSYVRTKFFANPVKIDQDNFIASLIIPKPIKRRRPRNSAYTKPHLYHLNFILPKKNGNTIPVCKKFFLAMLLVKGTRVNNIARKISKGEQLKEGRGGDHRSSKSTSKKENVREFIKSLKGTESHYNRKKSKRIYLDSNLNIAKLRKIYNESVSDLQKVSLSMFRKIFRNEFNIGFRSPASDICSLCFRLNSLIKTAHVEEKATLMMEKRIHKMRAKAFFEMLRKKSPQNTLSICFDMQQVQPLPKTPIQEAFYSRQIGFYVLCIVNTDGSNPVFYTWDETEAGRGAQEVSSALLDYLKNTDLTNIDSIKLFSDGCGAQNKNNIVLHSLMHWIISTAPKNIKNIQLTFPVRGHSFLPADRIFGQVEKVLRKKDTILTKEEYIDVYETVGTVRKIGMDWKLLNTKKLGDCFKNFAGISELKRIYIKKTATKNGFTATVKGCHNFRYESKTEVFKSLFKRGWSPSRCRLFKIPSIETGRSITEEKKKDVLDLLKKMFGIHWQQQPNLQYYKNILDIPQIEVVEENTVCDCIEDDSGNHI